MPTLCKCDGADCHNPNHDVAEGCNEDVMPIAGQSTEGTPICAKCRPVA